jgi:adenine-specific DNA-methyltransferase
MGNYIKSPLNYVGGKYKLLDEIIPLFPTDIDTFVDVFAGGVQRRHKCRSKKSNL